MVKILKYIVIIILLTLPLKAENINNVSINGNKRVSDETVKIYGEINNIKTYSQKNANTILKNLYETDFFEDVQISFENGTLIVNLKEETSHFQIYLYMHPLKKELYSLMLVRKLIFLTQ